jgi:hypothetical protein
MRTYSIVSVLEEVMTRILRVLELALTISNGNHHVEEGARRFNMQ